MEMHTRQLLAEYVALLNKHGVESRSPREFVDQHKLNSEFVELAELTRKLKLALTAPASYSVRPSGRLCEG
jgi:hypothetical protein